MPTNRKSASRPALLEDTVQYPLATGPAPLQWDGNWPATNHEHSKSLDVSAAFSLSRLRQTTAPVQAKTTPENEDPHLEAFKAIASVRWDDNREVVRSYIEDLLKLADKNQARFLLDRALKNGAAFTQRLACEALARLGKPGVQILIKNVVYKNQAVHADVLQALSLVGKDAVSEILRALEENPKSPQTLQRQVLVKHMSRYPDLDVSRYLCKLLVVELGELRHLAREGLLKQGRMAEAPLLELLKNQAERPELRKDCIYLLGLMRSRKAVPALLNQLSDEESPALLCLLAWALGEIGAADASAFLRFLLEDPTQSWMVQRALIQALGRLRDENSVELLVPFLNQRELRENVIEALGRIGSNRSLAALEPFLNSPVNYLRGIAITALARIGDRKALRLMLNGLTDVDPFVRNLTQKALEEFYSPEQMAEIYDRLEDDFKRQERREAWKRFFSSPAAATAALAEEDAAPEPGFSQSPHLEEEFYEPSLQSQALAPLSTAMSYNGGNPFGFPLASLDRDFNGMEAAKKPSLLRRLKQKIEDKVSEVL